MTRAKRKSFSHLYLALALFFRAGLQPLFGALRLFFGAAADAASTTRGGVTAFCAGVEAKAVVAEARIGGESFGIISAPGRVTMCSPSGAGSVCCAGGELLLLSPATSTLGETLVEGTTRTENMLLLLLLLFSTEVAGAEAVSSLAAAIVDDGGSSAE